MRMYKQKWIGDLILCFCYRNLLPACLPHIINESLSLSSFIHESKRQITQLTPSVMIWCHNPSHNITHTTLRENREAIAKLLEQWNETEGFRLLNCTHVGMPLDTCTEVAILQGRWKMRTYMLSLFIFQHLTNLSFSASPVGQMTSLAHQVICALCWPDCWQAEKIIECTHEGGKGQITPIFRVSIQLWWKDGLGFTE